MEKRFSPFNQIHKGLRAMLYETAMALQLTDFTDINKTGQVLDKVRVVLEVFHDHASQEDNFVLPAITTHHPHLSEEFEDEHKMDEILSQRIRSLMDTYLSADSPFIRRDIGEKLYTVYNEFIAFNLYHMNKEEEKLTPVFWEKYTDEEMLSIQKEIVKNIPQHLRPTINTWMLRGINDAEVFGWLSGVKRSGQNDAFLFLSSLAEKELSSERWRSLQENLKQVV